MEGIALTNAEHNDLSPEMIIQMYTTLLMMNGVNYITNRCARAMESLKVKGYNVKNNFWVKNRHTIDECSKHIRIAMQLLEKTADPFLDNVYNKCPGQEMKRYEQIEWMTAHLLKMNLIYISRIDGNPDKAASMLKAISNFKPDSDCPYNIQQVLHFYDLD